MEIINCARCRKVFTQIKSPLCPACEKEDEELFQSLRDYIEEHDNCTLSELSDATNVTPKKILGYIREGRLQISKGMQGDIRCEQCNCPISIGRYCDACMIKMDQKIKDMFNYSEEPTPETKMHILQKNKK